MKNENNDNDNIVIINQTCPQSRNCDNDDDQKL